MDTCGRLATSEPWVREYTIQLGGRERSFVGHCCTIYRANKWRGSDARHRIGPREMTAVDGMRDGRSQKGELLVDRVCRLWTMHTPLRFSTHVVSCFKRTELAKVVGTELVERQVADRLDKAASRLPDAPHRALVGMAREMVVDSS